MWDRPTLNNSCGSAQNTDFAIKLVVDEHDSEKDILLNWVGEIDTSLLDESYVEFGVEKIKPQTQKEEI